MSNKCTYRVLIPWHDLENIFWPSLSWILARRRFLEGRARSGGFGGSSSVGNFICQKLYKNATVWSTPAIIPAKGLEKRPKGVWENTPRHSNRWTHKFSPLRLNQLNICAFLSGFFCNLPPFLCGFLLS